MGIEAAKIYVSVGAKTDDFERGMNGVQSRLGSLGGIAQTAMGFLARDVVVGAVKGLANLGQAALGSYADFERMGMSLQSLAARELVNQSMTTTTTSSRVKATQEMIDRYNWLGNEAARAAEKMKGMEAGSDEAQRQGARLRELQMQMNALNVSADGYIAVSSQTTRQTLSLADAMAQAGPKAKELQGWVQQLAIKSPFTQKGAADAFRMGMAYGFTTDEAKRLTQAMTDYSAASGRGEETMGRVTLALGQIKAKGKLAGQEVLQLTEAGINVNDILARSFGKSTQEIVDMRERGLIPAGQAIEAIVAAMEKDYGGAAEKQATSFSGLLSSLQDIQEIGLRELFTGTFQEVQPYVAAFVDKMSDPAFMTSLNHLGSAVGKLVKMTLPDLGSFKSDMTAIALLIDKVTGGDWKGALNLAGFKLFGVSGLSEMFSGENIGETARKAAGGIGAGLLGGLKEFAGQTFASEYGTMVTEALTASWDGYIWPTLQSWTPKFWGWVGAAAAKTPEQLNLLLDGIAAFFGENGWQKIQEGVGGWSARFWEWANLAVGEAAYNLGKLIDAINTWSTDAGTQARLAAAGEAMGQAFANHIALTLANDESAAKLGAALANLLGMVGANTAINAATFAHSMANSFIKGFTDKLRESAPVLADVLKAVLTAAVDLTLPGVIAHLREGLQSLGDLISGEGDVAESPRRTGTSSSTTTSESGERRAMGGLALSGRRYLVGEKEPEIFTPRMSGTITPAHELGGGSVVVYGNLTIMMQGDRLSADSILAAAALNPGV